MEQQDTFYSKSEYIETASGNKVSRQSVLCGSQNIVLNGKTIIMANCIIRGDLANVRIGRHCVVSQNTVIRPPFKKFSKGAPSGCFCILNGDHDRRLPLLSVNAKTWCAPSGNKVTSDTIRVAFFPLHIGDHVVIEEGTVVNAAQVGSFVHIGKNCVIGRRCVLKDCCAVADNTVLPPETVVPPFTVYSGSPGKLLADLPECSQDLMIDITRNFYQHFVPDSKQGL